MNQTVFWKWLTKLNSKFKKHPFIIIDIFTLRNICNPSKLWNNQNGCIGDVTWQESFPPSSGPAHIMFSVIAETPLRHLHCLFPTTGTSTSCRTWGEGRETVKDIKWSNVHQHCNNTVCCVWSRLVKLKPYRLSEFFPIRWPSLQCCWRMYCLLKPDRLVWYS